jgi:Rap1a immunity proteins
MMRAYLIAAGLALSVIGNARGSVVDSGADAQKACQFLVEGSFGDSGDQRAAGACEGMIETAMVFSPNMPADTRACAPAQGSALESAKVLLRYMEKNPARLNEAGITLAIEALRDAWPCEGDDAGAPGRLGPKPKKRAAKKPASKPVEAPASAKQQ